MTGCPLFWKKTRSDPGYGRKSRHKECCVRFLSFWNGMCLMNSRTYLNRKSDRGLLCYGEPGIAAFFYVVAAVKRKPLSDIGWGSSRYLGRKDSWGRLPLYIFIESVYNRQKRTNVREKRREVWRVQYCTVMRIVLCDLKVTTFIVLP